MQTIVVILVAFVREIVLSRATLQLENIALRQQVAVLKRERPRPWLRPLDRVFCAGFSDALALLEADARCLPASEKRQGTKSREAGRVLWGFDCGDSDGGAWIA